MPSPLKKLFFIVLYNSSLFLILIFGIQNSIKKSRVNFVIGETINLPTGFIVGTSFIAGSIIGATLPTIGSKKDEFLESD